MATFVVKSNLNVTVSVNIKNTPDDMQFVYAKIWTFDSALWWIYQHYQQLLFIVIRQMAAPNVLSTDTV